MDKLRERLHRAERSHMFIHKQEVKKLLELAGAGVF